MSIPGAGTSYTDRMTTAETIQYYLRKMADEAASDGFDKEFEDLVDLLMFTISPMTRKANLTEKWQDINKIGKGLDVFDTVKMGQAKRQRSEEMMVMAMKIIDDNKMLFRNVNTFKWEFDPMELEKDTDGE